MSSYNNSPYKVIPTELYSAYSMNGKNPILDMWFDNRDSLEVPTWTHTYVSEFVANFTPSNIKQNTHGYEPYGNASRWILSALEKFSIVGKRVAVVGSLTPWIEAILLNMGNTVTTVEYNVPTVEYPGLTAISYDAFVESSELYDAIVTYSSVEHSGLGRYGDPLDPDGDLKTMNAICRHLIDKGTLVWGAPVGHDALVWNAHRIYGSLRLPLLFSGFKELEWIDFNKSQLLSLPLSRNSVNPVVVLEKI